MIYRGNLRFQGLCRLFVDGIIAAERIWNRSRKSTHSISIERKPYAQCVRMGFAHTDDQTSIAHQGLRDGLGPMLLQIQSTAFHSPERPIGGWFPGKSLQTS